MQESESKKEKLTSVRVPGSIVPGAAVSSAKNPTKQKFSVVDVNYDPTIASFIQNFLGAEKANRLESIMSEAVIFAMNSGQWKHAKLAQRAYEQIAPPFALGPIVAGVYISLGFGRISESLQYLESIQDKVAAKDVWGLRAFLGMFMIFSERKGEAQEWLERVVLQGDDASSAMAEQLLLQFFARAKDTTTKPSRNARVPGVPL